MKFGIVTLMCLELAIGMCYSKSIKIVGGEDAEIMDFTYQVSLRYESLNWHFCGGAIISTVYVITVAHCMHNKMFQLYDIKVYTGCTRLSNKCGDAHRIFDVHLYKDYVAPLTVEQLQRYDIAIIKVNKPILFNKYQRKIDLPIHDIVIDDIGIGTGWGITTFPSTKPSEQLQQITMKIKKTSDCAQLFKSKMHEEHFCAFDKMGSGMCIGDSGGPLVSSGRLVGLMTYIMPCGKGYPDIFINVYHYLDFIKSFIEK